MHLDSSGAEHGERFVHSDYHSSESGEQKPRLDKENSGTFLPLLIDSFITDIYVCCVSYTHSVASQPNFIALVATTVETSTPREELKPGLNLLGKIEQIFYTESDLYEPIDDGTKSGVCFDFID